MSTTRRKRRRYSEEFVAKAKAEAKDLQGGQFKSYAKKNGIPISTLRSWFDEERGTNAPKYTAEFKGVVILETDGMRSVQMAQYARDNRVPYANIQRWRKQRRKIMAAAEAEQAAATAGADAGSAAKPRRSKAPYVEMEASDVLNQMKGVMNGLIPQPAVDPATKALILDNKKLTQERDRLSQQLMELRRNHDRLVTDNRTMSDRIELAEAAWKKASAEHQMTVERLRRQLTQAKDELAQAGPRDMKTIRKLEGQLNEANRTTATLKSELEIKARVASHYKQAKAEIEDLKAALSRKTQSHQGTHQLKAEVARLKGVIADLYMGTLGGDR